MAIKVLKDPKPVGVNIEQDDLDYLEENGISRTRLLRQAIQAVRDGKFKYQYKKNK